MGGRFGNHWSDRIKSKVKSFNFQISILVNVSFSNYSSVKTIILYQANT